MKPLDAVVLRDGRLTLRPPAESDVPAITAACQDPELHRWLAALPYPYSEEDARAFVASRPQARADGGDLALAVTAADGGRLLGMVGLHDIRERDAADGGQGEIGFWVVASERGRGIMPAAARLVCSYGFAPEPDGLGLGRIEWQAEAGNGSSLRVAEKLGFTFEGTCRRRLLHRGRRVDGWLAGLVPDDLQGRT
jgi:RimJ/RimL family protein N-acetyltransferase